MDAALPLPRPRPSEPAARILDQVHPLAELRPGERATVHAVDTDTPLGRRLIDLGFRPGTEVRVVRRAPLGDPVSYALRGSQVCLRRAEAAQIAVFRAAPE